MNERKIIIDTETTGLSPEAGHRMIELAAVELINRRLTGNILQFYLNPEREVDQEAFYIHGISDDFLLDKPYFADIAQTFIDFITGSELVIHNAPFDVGFINHELALLGKKRPCQQLSDCCSVFDTLAYARKKHPGQANSLDALCKRYGVNNSHRELHGALLDANLLARVYLALTGGQIGMTLLLEEQEKNTDQQLPQAAALRDYQTPVIKATQEELTQHEAFLQMLQQLSGQPPAWRQAKS